MRRLIVNADDFGLTSGVNRAVVEAHKSGIVTSATLMANGRAFNEAVAAARGAPSLAVGCHIVLVDGSPVLSADECQSLMAKSGNGSFRTGFLQVGTAALRRRLDPQQIEAEATAQIRRLQAAGISVSHFDTHKHTHILPAVLRPLLRASQACGVRALRNPFAPVKPLAVAHLLRRPHLWKRYSQVRVLRGWHERFRRMVAEAGMVTTDGTLGIVSTGALGEELFAAIVGSMPDGTWEFVCHPGYNDAELGSIRTRLRESRAKELEVLTSPAAREILERHGIQLISYRDLLSGVMASGAEN